MATEATTGASPDAVELVTADHRGVDQLFKQLHAASTPKSRTEIGQRIIEELSVHAAVEEQILYPGARRALQDASIVDHAIEEHDELKRVLADLDGRTGEDPEFMTGFTTAEGLVTEHVQEEESTLLPRLRSNADQTELQKMGAAMQAAKRLAPTRPHPNAPSEPPANIVLGPVMAMVDKVRDAARNAFQRT